MPFTLIMPKLSPTMESGTIVKWHKKVGDEIKPDDLLFEVATDKATVEYNALDAGWLAKILIDENKEAIVNQPVAILTEKQGESIEGFKVENPIEESASKQEQPKENLKEDKKPQQTVEKKETAKPSFAPPPPPSTTASKNNKSTETRVMASPLAKKLAEQQGLDLSNLQGTGPSGRIMSKDLANAPKAGGSRGSRSLPNIAPGSYTEETLSPMRKVISQRLQESKSYIPHFYVQQTVDAEPLVKFREQLKHNDYSISFNDCVIKACAIALKSHPVVNSGFNSSNNTIIHYQTVDVAVAVSIPGGLITPIIRFTDYKELSEISQEIKELAKRAKAGKLEAHEYQGGSFTVSNLGMFGTTQFQAIINPPQAAILAVGGILDVPVVKDGEVVAGKVMNLTLSVDHRVVDGVAAAEFMRTVQKLIENPAGLLIN
jgi:pyruvate dehydrogenase E2 component (dihydrolipoamide acetyltransferase)